MTIMSACISASLDLSSSSLLTLPRRFGRLACAAVVKGAHSKDASTRLGVLRGASSCPRICNTC